MARKRARALILRPPAGLTAHFPELTEQTRQLFSQHANHQPVDAADLKALGSALWQIMDVDAALAAARQADAATDLLPLIIVSADPAVQALPWECLYHPDYGFLGQHPDFALSRRPPSGGMFARTWRRASRLGSRQAQRAPLRILLFSCLPTEQDNEPAPLDPESEQAHLLEALDPLLQAGQVEIVTADDGSFFHLQALLREQPFQWVVLSGTGALPDTASSTRAEAAILFEGLDGYPDPVPASALAHAFRDTAIRTVILSLHQPTAAPPSELGPRLALPLYQAGLAQVIGLHQPLQDSASRCFAGVLCQALAERGPLDQVLQTARAALAEAATDAAAQDAAAEHSPVGQQWYLPVLYSDEPDRPLVEQLPAAVLPDGPEPTQAPPWLGRRRELRLLRHQLAHCPQWLITGAAGTGKTRLVEHLLQRLETQGWLVYAFDARSPLSWNDFIAMMLLELEDQARQEINRQLGCLSALEQARLIIDALLRQTDHKLALALDNLEAVQDASGELMHDGIATWLQACDPASGPVPVIFLLSRRGLPGWTQPERWHYPLQAPSYSDFVRYYQHLRRRHTDKLPLRRLYQAMEGNFKSLELCRGLWQSGVSAAAILRKLEQNSAQSPLELLIEQVIGLLEPPQFTLLIRLQVYDDFIFADGVRFITQDLAAPQQALQRLLTLGLVEHDTEAELQLDRYRLAPVVADWLQQQGYTPERTVRHQAARYQRWAFEHLQHSLDQALLAYAALQQNELDKEATQFALDTIVPLFDLAGLHFPLLNDWLPILRAAQDEKQRWDAFCWSGKIFLQTGNYDTAQNYLELALNIFRETEDRQGEGATLNSLSQIHQARGDYDTAIDCLKQVLAIRRTFDKHTGLCATLYNLGHLHLEKNEPKQFVAYLAEAYEIAKDIGYGQMLRKLDLLAKQFNGSGIEDWARLHHFDKFK